MNWLITGGCGFIGTALAASLLKAGVRNIRIVDNLSTGSREDLGRICYFEERGCSGLPEPVKGVELLCGDIMDRELAYKAATGIDIVVHLAASTGVLLSVEDPHSDCMANVIGTLNYLDAARQQGVKKFIFASSAGILGEQECPLHEEKVPKPMAPYGASKLAGEAYCSAFFRTFGLSTVALRFGNVYGPGSINKGSVVAKFIKHAIAGQQLEVYGDGKQTRDFIFIDDLIDAILKAAQSNVAGEVFQIATNLETTISELLEILLPILQSELPDRPVEIVHSGSRKGEVRRNYSDTSKARRLINWQSRTDLRQGLERTVSWFMEMRKCV